MTKSIVHFEIPTKDAQRAKKFYDKVFGYKFSDSNIPGVEYYVIDGIEPGGALNPQASEQKGGILVYFGSDNIDASVKKVRDQGGKADDKLPIPGQGWFSFCQDPEGNAFGLYQDDPSVPMEMPAQEARA